MKVDIWKDLAKKLAKRVCPFIEFKSGTKVEEEFMADLLEEEIKKFAEEYIARIYFMVEKDEDISKTS